MHSKKLSDDLSIAAQISVSDIAAIKAAGFQAIICNRPDGEMFGQPRYRDIEAAATAAGLAIRHQPISPGRMTDADAAAFAASLRELPKPVLAFCASGNRAGSLWAQAQAKGLVSV